MKLKLILSSLIFITTTMVFSQDNNDNWDNLNFLLGNWKGEGSGIPGEGTGYFSFTLELDKKILIRKSHSEYPDTKANSLIKHDDLMIIYLNNSGIPDKAIYFDNEGHVINYSISFPDDKDMVFISDKMPNVPVFRLTYSKIIKDVVNTKFEISQDGQNFVTYIEGRSKRIE